jgi:hypothetical protein
LFLSADCEAVTNLARHTIYSSLFTRTILPAAARYRLLLRERFDFLPIKLVIIEPPDLKNMDSRRQHMFTYGCELSAASWTKRR